MASKSRFYVDTPRDPSQRHSMFVTHSELAQRQDHPSSSSSSATLPSAAGSVDRLTGLEESKRSPRFFTLKPKSSFSLRPLFKSTSSLVSLTSSPGNKRREGFVLERRDSCSQTDEGARPELGEVGVQTLNASTVDVPVQTCLEAWEEQRGDGGCGKRRPAYASARASPRWSRPSVAPSALSNPLLLSRKAADDPLASPKLVKYAAPGGDSAKAALRHHSSVPPVDVNSCQSILPPPPLPQTALTFASESVLKTSPKELSKGPAPLSAKPDSDHHSDTSSNTALPDARAPVKENETSVRGNETLHPRVGKLVEYRAPDVSSDLKHPVPHSVEYPVSVLKTERTDSPSRRLKSVHFDLSETDPPKQLESAPQKPRNIDKDFEALLKDLNILSDDESDLSVCISPPPSDKRPSSNLLSPTLKSAIDALKVDFLAPILETSNECNSREESPKISEVSDTLKANKSSEIQTKSDPEVELLDLTPDLFESKDLSAPSVPGFECQDSLGENKNDSSDTTSPSLFTSAKSVSNPETDSLEGNVYDNVIKEENLVKTVPLPTLPSFFQPPSDLQSPEANKVVEFVGSDKPDTLPDNQIESAMPLETDFDRNRLSRSSSRSSIRSNSKVGCDTYSEPINKFDSCENLDQLEEEIIRSLYSPDERNLEENLMKNMELPPSESFQNSGTTATHMRRVILDQLLSGKSVHDIVPNYPVYQRAISQPETGSKFKSPAKYTAVLTKIEREINENPNSSLAGSSFNLPLNDSNVSQNTSDTKENGNVTAPIFSVKNVTNSPKKTSVFIFPVDNSSTSNSNQEKPTEISTKDTQSKGPSLLEVRRSSWNPETTSEDNRNSNQNGDTDRDKEKSDKKTGQCDFTSCLRPSKIQNSPFLAKINTRSMSPCSFSPMPPVQSSTFLSRSSANKKNDSAGKPREVAGECDFASCLKPSQVQNSLFTAELNEITAGKSTTSLRAGSPLSVRTHSPLSVRSSSLDNPYSTAGMQKMSENFQPVKLKSETTSPIEEKKESESNISNSSEPIAENFTVVVEKKNNPDDSNCEPVNHKSEILITLQTSSNHSSDTMKKPKILTKSDNLDEADSVSSTVSSLEDNIEESPKDNLESKTEIVSASTPPPPPPPLPSNALKFSVSSKEIVIDSTGATMENQRTNSSVVDIPRSSTPKTPLMVELESKVQNKCDSDGRIPNDKLGDQYSPVSCSPDEPSNAGRPEANLNGSSNYVSNGNQNGGIGFLSEQREFNSSLPNDRNGGHSPASKTLAFSPTTVVTDEPPPSGAVLLDKKVTIDGDKVHTDKYYAIPVKEVLKEKTSTTKFIPAPPKYDGIGPTEDGIPIGLRNSVKKENMHNWYKTMFKSLHRADLPNDSQEYIIGYTSEPETSKKDIMLRKKSSLDSRLKYDINSNQNKQDYTPVVKSSIEVYNVHPRLIEDYEPGYSSITDDDVNISKRYLPSKNTVKPSYEFKNGYESDSNITKKRDQPEALNSCQQKMWYREIQKGGDIPQFGLNKPCPDKPKEPSIGPVPPPPLNYNGPTTYQAVRPLTLPADYANQNGNGYCQQMNGVYEMQMRLAIHSEMQQRMSPSSNQLSPPNRVMMKSPSRSPDLNIQAQALFDFKAESPKEIPLKKGDIVLILRQLDKNWYEGEHKGVVGIFPISYVEIIPPEHASTPIKIKPEGLGRALYDFVGQTSIELTVRKGDTITLLRRVDANWFEGIFNSKKGIVPISYIQVLQEPVERNINSPSQKSFITSPSLSQSSEKQNKPSSISPSAYSSSSSSPLPVNQEKRKLSNKKGISLIEPVMYRALYSYTPQNSDELELQEGDSVYVVEMCDDGWFVGTSVRTGVFGIFPGNYVEKAC